MSREVHVRFCERPEVRFLRPTHPYIPTWAGFLYLAVVLDAFSRRVVGWAMATTLATQLVLDALNMALLMRRTSGVIHHSDQGSQYTSIAFGHRCREAGVRPSMGSVGDAYDNAMCESFFATLECELLARHRFKTPAEARRAVFAFIEGFYNPRRRHSSLNYLSPIEYERRHYAMIVVADDDQPAAVLAAVKDASRRLRRSPAAILDRRCARLQPGGGPMPQTACPPSSHLSTKPGQVHSVMPAAIAGEHFSVLWIRSKHSTAPT